MSAVMDVNGGGGGGGGGEGGGVGHGGADVKAFGPRQTAYAGSNPNGYGW